MPHLSKLLPSSVSLDGVQLSFTALGYEINVNLLATITGFLAILVVSSVTKLIKGLRAVNFLPGVWVPFQGLALPGAAFRTMRINPGLNFCWVNRWDLYKRFNREVVSMIPFFSGVPNIYTSNMDVARQVIVGGQRTDWIKPESASGALLLWGMNLVAAEKDVWRKHRRIMSPAFNKNLYSLVWDKTIQSYQDMVATEGWATKDTFEIPIVQHITHKFTLLILGRCAFGLPLTWAAPNTAKDGSMSIEKMLQVISDSSLFTISMPWFAWFAPIGWVQEIRRAHKQLGAFMHSEVANRKKMVQEQITHGIEPVPGGEGSDVFSLLVRANELDKGNLKMDESELFGNIYVLLFAGHETSAHTLAATLALLAYHQEIQDEAVEQIVDVVGWERTPAFEDYQALDKVLAVFYEALRMFPSAHVLIREATEDTMLTIPNPPGEEGTTTIPIEKGAQVVVDMVGIQYNPRYFDEPEMFKPSRWHGASEETVEKVTAFSFGPRECIGKEFSSTSSVCFLSLLLRDWKVEPLLRVGETKEMWKARILEAEVVITLGVRDVPVKFVKRKRY